jgi:hypothetical protein
VARWDNYFEIKTVVVRYFLEDGFATDYTNFHGLSESPHATRNGMREDVCHELDGFAPKHRGRSLSQITRILTDWSKSSHSLIRDEKTLGMVILIIVPVEKFGLMDFIGI